MDILAGGEQRTCKVDNAGLLPGTKLPKG